ncbi:MAG: hypothetical protein DRZ82_07695 [Thermoprotei archaeon]|nr:MAG: hypothetical protein DRZ82_07695 [Thermoprotei archaeon]
MDLYKYILAFMISINMTLLIMVNTVCLASIKYNTFKKWLINHTFKVNYKAYYNHDKENKILHIRITFKILKGLNRKLLGLEIINDEFTINITRYGSINEVNKRLAERLRLNEEELNILKDIGVLIKNLGNSTEVLTTKDGPPSWWEEPPYLPRYAYEKDGDVYKATDPII